MRRRLKMPNTKDLSAIKPSIRTIGRDAGGKPWYICPVCKTRLFKLKPGTKIEMLEYKCRRCKNIFEVNVNIAIKKAVG
jgi:DNA-directed RNA polymerase subunit RPC12/RpoP